MAENPTSPRRRHARESHRPVRNLLDDDEIGKQMDFLLQEMQREANTISSQSAGLGGRAVGIALKADIEKIARAGFRTSSNMIVPGN